MALLIATGNRDKISEFQALFAPIPCIGQKAFQIESPEETGLTFIENALIKARHAATIAKMPVLADDSGLVIPALKGAPGIYSARYAGLNASYKENMELVLSNLKGMPEQQRKAYFYSVLVYMESETDPKPLIAEGLWEGFITETIQGTSGFGYDPIFYLPEFGKTVGALEEAVKNAHSHRAKAVQALKSLKEWKVQ